MWLTASRTSFGAWCLETNSVYTTTRPAIPVAVLILVLRVDALAIATTGYPGV